MIAYSTVVLIVIAIAIAIVAEIVAETAILRPRPFLPAPFSRIIIPFYSSEACPLNLAHCAETNCPFFNLILIACL